MEIIGGCPLVEWDQRIIFIKHAFELRVLKKYYALAEKNKG